MIKLKFKDKQGSMLVYGVAVILSMLLIVAGVTEYFRLKTITSNIKDVLQAAVINTTLENYESIFSSNREGYISGHIYNDCLGTWEEMVNEGDIYMEMSELLGLERDSDCFIKYSGGGGGDDAVIEYQISGLQVVVTSPPIRGGAAAGTENKFTAESILDFEMPHAFAWEHLPPLRLKLKVKSEYMVMF